MVFYSTSSSKPPEPYQELLNHSVVRKDSKCSQGHSYKTRGFISSTTEGRLRGHFMKSSYFPDEDLEFSLWSNSLYVLRHSLSTSTFKASVVAIFQ